MHLFFCVLLVFPGPVWTPGTDRPVRNACLMLSIGMFEDLFFLYIYIYTYIFKFLVVVLCHTSSIVNILCVRKLTNSHSV